MAPIDQRQFQVESRGSGVESRQSSSQSFGVLVYGMSQDNFEKWRELCSKILGSKEHASITQENFSKAKAEYYRLLQRDEAESKAKLASYIDDRAIRLLPKKEDPDSDLKNTEMKMEDSRSLDTQDSSQFDISYESSASLVKPTFHRLEEIN